MLDIVDSLTVYVLLEDYAGYNSSFIAQHGVSFLVEARSGSQRIKVLFDAGPDHEHVLSNAVNLGLSLRDIDYVVLSHSHYDHTGGLIGLLRHVRKTLPIVAHPDIFKMVVDLEPRLRYVGIPPDPATAEKEIEELGGMLILSKNPVKLAAGISTTGEIRPDERVDYEKQATLKLFRVVDGEILEDPINEEIGLAINMRDGVVVIAGCSHPGIVSMAKKAAAVFNKDRVKAVIGGFHLINADDARISRTIEGLKELGVKDVYTGHCTGLKAEYAFMQGFGDGFRKLHAGMVISFS